MTYITLNYDKAVHDRANGQSVVCVKMLTDVTNDSASAQTVTYGIQGLSVTQLAQSV